MSKPNQLKVTDVHHEKLQFLDRTQDRGDKWYDTERVTSQNVSPRGRPVHHYFNKMVLPQPLTKHREQWY